MTLFVLCYIAIIPQQVEAAVTGQETEVTLLDTRVGRYKINYTGNTNHYTCWNPNGTFIMQHIYNDLGGGYTNSSVATLSRITGTSKIKYAYLVWETRAPQGATSPIGIITPTGYRYSILPTYAINDYRIVGSNPGITSMFCMAADVTSVVQSGGYGAYAVCNIPMWVCGQNGDWTGGESPGSWQLIVVEEDDSFPVKAVTMSIGARFYMSTDFGSVLTLGNGLKSKSAGMATGQIFFGATNSARTSPMTENISTYNGSGGLIGQVVSNTTYSAGLYRNGNLINDRDYGNGCIRMDLSNIESNMGNNANQIHMTVQNKDWTTSFLLGMAVDIAYPDFTGMQITTVNSPTSVTVTGEFKNVASTPNTGIYNGRMNVSVDSGLTPVSATAIVDDTTAIAGAINGNTVTFSGRAVASMMNSSTIRYTVECVTNNSGKTIFNNQAGFHGYLRADGIDTGYWIDRMWVASSSAVPEYSVQLEPGIGIETVTGGGSYPYNSNISIGAVVKPGYHWKGWTGSRSTAVQDYNFKMPSSNLSMRAEAEENTYTIVFDANDGVEVTPMDDIVASYGTEFILPDGTAYYEKYTLDGADVTGESQRGYPSVFLGWSLEKGENRAIAQWKAGTTVKVGELADILGVAEQDGAQITLYAAWDDCPWIQATDRYYTLEQAQSGFITQEEILRYATAFDREDGSPIAPGFHENGTSFSIPDYSPTDFTQLQQEGCATENLTVVDSVGNVYEKQITVYVVDTTSVAVKTEGTTRFIDEHYYNQPYENGGLEEQSIWLTDSEYVETIQEAFDNIRNDKAIQTYYFTHEDVLQMKEFIEVHGVESMKDPDVLQEFYNRFLALN